MMRWIFLCAVVACGGTDFPCEKLSAWNPGAHAGTCGLYTPPNGFTNCAAAVDRCADWERSVLSDVADCFNALPVCRAGLVQSFVDAETACTVLQNKVTTACLNGFSAKN